MCRLVAYLGQPVKLERIVSEPEHSLVIQSYRPREMISGVVNADGFGIGWYNRTLDPTPCVYTNPNPIWSDRNLPGLGRHIVSECIFANVRSATPGLAVDQSNCQPFAYQQLLFMHNGYIENFRVTLMRQTRALLQDVYYTAIGGSTDSEHIFALLLHTLHGRDLTAQTVSEALCATIRQLVDWAVQKDVQIALNMAVTNGEFVVASRFATAPPAPSLYYIHNTAWFPQAIVLASEQLFMSDDWVAIPEGHVVSFDAELKVSCSPICTREAVSVAAH